MRILVAHYLPDIVSGAERAIADMLHALDSRFEPVMLTPGPGSLADFYRAEGFAVWERRIDTVRRLYPGLHTLQSGMFAALLKREGFQRVLSNTFAAASRVGDAARWAGIPHLIYVREYFSDRPRHRQMLAQASRILAVSQDIQRHIEGMTGTDRVRLAYDLVQIPPIQERVAAHRTGGKRLLPFPPENPVVGWIGRITPYKQPDLFLRAIPQILSTDPHARFVVIGSAAERDSEYADHLHKLAHTLEIDSQLAFLGNRPDVIELMSELAVMCVTSSREPFPRVILEAQAAGCAVVSANTGGCKEMVVEGVSGLFFDPLSTQAPVELAGQVSSLLHDPELRSRLSRQAGEAVENTFGGSGPARSLEQILEELEPSHVISI